MVLSFLPHFSYITVAHATGKMGREIQLLLPLRFAVANLVHPEFLTDNTIFIRLNGYFSLNNVAFTFKALINSGLTPTIVQ